MHHTPITSPRPTKSLPNIFYRLGRAAGARTMDATGDTIKRQTPQTPGDASKTSENNLREIRAAIRKNALEILIKGQRRRKEINEILAQARKNRAEIREILRRGRNAQRS